MMVTVRRGVVLGLALVLIAGLGECADWTKLADGLLLGRFAPGVETRDGDPIVVLRVDPSKHTLKLLSALDQGGRPRACRQWCEEFGLLAAINAGMYNRNLQSTGFMKDRGYTNNPQVNAAFGAFLVFNPKEPSIPKARILDSRNDKDWRQVLERYHSAIQSYRMISGGKKVKWPIQDKASSIAAAGVDQDGRLLFIHSRTPSTPHAFIETLLSLPIRVRDAIYLEGGGEASLCARVGGKWVEWAGQSDIEILRSLQLVPSIPNVLGVEEAVPGPPSPVK